MSPGTTGRSRETRLQVRQARLRQLPGRADLSGFVRQLRGVERASAVRTLVDGVIVTVRLRRRGVRSLVAGPGGSGLQDAARATHVATAVDAAFALIPVAPTCLRRSVTLVRELNRLGLAATLHLGVRTTAGRVEAHAWVQAGNVVVNDDRSVAEEYQTLAAGELERMLPLLR